MHSMVKMTGLATAAVAMAFTMAACGDDGGDDVAGFCERNEEFEEQSDRLFEGALAAADDSGLDDAKDAFSDANDALAGLADAAPDEIEDDVETLASAFDDANGEIQDAESVEDVQGLGGDLDSEETNAAADRVEEWIDDNCDSGGRSADPEE